MQPFAGLRVLDFTIAWAGPFVGRWFGAFGADVVKVESAQRIDLWRTGAVPAQDGAPLARPYNHAPNFNGLNRNKRGLGLELDQPEGRAVFLRMVARADIVVANFTARVLPNLRLTYADLTEANPKIILINMPSLGATGPFRDLAGYGSIIEGMGGFAARFGRTDEGARVSSTFYPDAVAGIHATVAVLAALRKRVATGEGSSIDLSQQETMWMQMGEDLVSRSLTGRDTDRLENGEPGRVPSGFFPTSDGRWLAIVVSTDAQYSTLVAAAGPHLDTLNGLTSQGRLQRRTEIEAALGQWTASRPLDELIATLGAGGVRAAAVNTYREGADAPALHRIDAFEQVRHTEAGEHPHIRIPIRVDGESTATRLPGVRFSEHTDAVLRDWLDMAGDEIALLRAAGVICDQPA